jgi:bacteriorhodopsin
MFAAFARTKVQWGYYVISSIAFLYVVLKLVISSRRAAITRSATVGKFFTAISLYTIVIWVLYPIVWALGEGTQRISVNSEIILYAVVSGSWDVLILA